MTSVTDQKLKAYFLGSLVAAEAERLEEECASSAELTERAQIVEAELADDFLRGNLAVAERRLFEQNYLTNEARREKLRLTEHLWKIAAENQTPAQTSAPAFWQILFGGSRRLAFGGLAAAILFAGLVYVWLNSNKNSEIVRQENTNQSSNFNAKVQSSEETQNVNAVSQNQNVNSNLANHDSQKSNRAPKPTATPETKTTPERIESTAPTMATFVLLPGTLRSEGEQFIKISPNTNKINLRLNLPKDAIEYPFYRAVVQTADGEIVLTSPNLKFPNFTIPAKRLENRTYLVFLEGQKPTSQSAEPVAEYSFRVRR